MKKLMMILLMSGFCLAVSAPNVLAQDTTRTRQDTTKTDKKKKKDMKHKDKSKQDSTKHDQKRDTTTRPPQK